MPSLGYVRSAVKGPDEKPDLTIEMLKLASTPPASADNKDLVLGNLDQLRLGTCVPNSGAQLIRCSHVKQRLDAGETLERIRALPPKLLARLFMYWLCRSFWHELFDDSGTQVRTFFEMLNKFGFCIEDLWTYDDTNTGSPKDKFRLMPSTVAFEAAFGQSRKVAEVGGRPVRYHRIVGTGDARIDAVKRALASRMPVEFGTDVSGKFANLDIDPNKPLVPPKPGEKIAGGHAMILTGYDNDACDALTPWGDAYNGGYFRFSWEYLVDSRTDDLWVADAAPVYEAAS